MNKHCLDIELLEAVARDASGGGALPGYVHDHLASCRFCRENFESFLEQMTLTKRFFPSFSEAAIEKISQRVTELNPDSFTLIARPLAPGGKLGRPDNKNGYTWAADSETIPAHKRYANRGVLSTAGGELLIRLIENKAGREIVLHLISENPEQLQNVPVRIEPLGLDLMSDKQGRVVLPQVVLPPLDELEIVVRTPRAVFTLQRMVKTWKEFIGKGEIRLKDEHEGALFIEFYPEGGQYQLNVRLDKSRLTDGTQIIQVIADKTIHTSSINTLDKGIAVFHEVSETPNLHIRVFG